MPPPHRHHVGTPIIFLDTKEHGAVLAQLPPQAGINRYSTQAHGRPETPGQGAGNGRPRNNIDETILRPGMTVAQKADADAGLLVWVRTLSVADRNALKALKIVVRDDSGSTDHEVSEAIRYVEAITVVEGE